MFSFHLTLTRSVFRVITMYVNRFSLSNARRCSRSHEVDAAFGRGEQFSGAVFKITSFCFDVLSDTSKPLLYNTMGKEHFCMLLGFQYATHIQGR